MTRRATAIAIGGLLVVVSGVAALIHSLPEAADSDYRPTIDIERISPSPSELVVRASAFSPVKFTYVVKNTGKRPFTNLDIDVSCACQIETNIKKPLQPSESCKVAMQVRAPNFGVTRQRIAIREGGQKVAEIVNSVAALVDLPQIVSAPNNMSLRFVVLDEKPQQLEIKIAESPQERPWLTGLACLGDDVVGFSLQSREDTVTAENDCVLRTYRFDAVCRSEKPIESMIMVSPVHDTGFDKKVAPFGIRLSVVPRFDIFPKVVHADDVSGSLRIVPGKVNVINRTPGPFEVKPSSVMEGVKAVELDSQDKNRVRTFALIPDNNGLTSQLSGTLEFEIDGSSPLLLRVERRSFDPIQSSMQQ